MVRVAGAVDVDPKLFASWTKRHPDRVKALAATMDESSSSGALAVALAEPDPRARIAACNEALRDLAADVSWGEAIPDAALRACAFGTLLAVSGVLIGREDLTARLLEVLAIGLGGTLAVLDVRRIARAYAIRWRVGLDAWVAASVAPDEVAAPAQTSRRAGAGGRRR